jgi:hypothetical protein
MAEERIARPLPPPAFTQRASNNQSARVLLYPQSCCRRPSALRCSVRLRALSLRVRGSVLVSLHHHLNPENEHARAQWMPILRPPPPPPPDTNTQTRAPAHAHPSPRPPTTTTTTTTQAPRRAAAPLPLLASAAPSSRATTSSATARPSRAAALASASPPPPTTATPERSARPSWLSRLRACLSTPSSCGASTPLPPRAPACPLDLADFWALPRVLATWWSWPLWR